MKKNQKTRRDFANLKFDIDERTKVLKPGKLLNPSALNMFYTTHEEKIKKPCKKFFFEKQSKNIDEEYRPSKKIFKKERGFEKKHNFKKKIEVNYKKNFGGKLTQDKINRNIFVLPSMRNQKEF